MPLCMSCGSMHGAGQCPHCFPGLAGASVAGGGQHHRAAPPVPSGTSYGGASGMGGGVPISSSADPDDFNHLFSTSPVAVSTPAVTPGGGGGGGSSTSAPKRGFLSSMAGMIGDGIQMAKTVAHRGPVDPSAQGGVRKIQLGAKPVGNAPIVIDQAAQMRFFTSFPAIPRTEPLIGEFWCRAISGDTILEGSMFLSAHHFCFVAPYNNRAVTVALSLEDMLEIKRIVETGRDKNGMPQFRRVEENEDPSASGLQMFSSDMLMHTFFDVCLVDNFESWFKLVELAWKRTIRKQQTKQSVPQSTTSQQPVSIPQPPLLSFDT